PEIKIEFSRVSRTRKGALTLVIDPEHGALSQVAYSWSNRATIEEVVEDLRCREETTLGNIGYVDLQTDTGTYRDAETGDSIRTWMKASEVDAVVWTDLSSNFEERTKQQFSVPAAISYLKGLPETGRAEAKKYFAEAPSFVKTPLRTAVSK
ncbi:hypothetical protein HY624_03760, partial [Candidatus Uhrbacteria bacterium]|nr:hypothetical protein [Candidatus Uhrbacteria bacterium]